MSADYPANEPNGRRTAKGPEQRPITVEAFQTRVARAAVGGGR